MTTEINIQAFEFRPLGDRVVIRPETPKPRGLVINPFLADHAKREEINVGVVVAMGPGMKTKKKPGWAPNYRRAIPEFIFGRRVVYYQDAAYKIDLPVVLDGETILVEHHIIHDSSVEGVIVEGVIVEGSEEASANG